MSNLNSIPDRFKKYMRAAEQYLKKTEEERTVYINKVKDTLNDLRKKDK